MRIQSLTLKNFRSHEETVLVLDRFNFIRGPNGCGKSSIQMALEFLFTGRCELTDAAGRGAEGLIRSGAKEFVISATLENGDTLCRRRSARAHTVALNGKRVPIEAAQKYIEKRLGPSDMLSAVLQAGRFGEMREAEQKKLLVRVLDAGRVEVPDEVCDLRARARPFAARLGEHLGVHGYACKLTLEPFSIEVRQPERGGWWLSVRQLSESERFRFGIALQLALAIATGIDWIVIDRAGLLDREQRRLLTKLLLASGLDQAIVLATSDEPLSDGLPDGVRFIDLARRESPAGVRTPAP